jgi:hypothetical protein
MSEIPTGPAAPPPTNPPLQIGSSMVPLYVDRKMKLYLVTDNEFESLSTQNGQATVFIAVASATLSVAISIWINAIFYTEVPAPALVAKYLGAPVLLLVAATFFYLAYGANKARGNTWTTIKSESASRASAESASLSA